MSAQASVEMFYGALLLVNLVVGSGVLRSSSSFEHERVVGVPLIHDEEVGPLRIAIKKRFPVKKDPPSSPLGEDVGEGACGVPMAR